MAAVVAPAVSPCLRGVDQPRTRPKCKDHRGCRNHQDRSAHQAALPGRAIGKCAARYLSDHGEEIIGGQGEADHFLGPAQPRQVEGHEGPVASLHVGDKKVHPVQAISASPRGRHAHRALRIAIARERLVEARQARRDAPQSGRQLLPTRRVGLKTRAAHRVRPRPSGCVMQRAGKRKVPGVAGWAASSRTRCRNAGHACSRVVNNSR
jgi:hypothetical protein